nr:MAG TPA: hypothetical protein [Caudoviricetes sp.]
MCCNIIICFAATITNLLSDICVTLLNCINYLLSC